MTDHFSDAFTRRLFLKTSAAAAAGLMIPTHAYANGSETIKIGLIGSGGRGTGAASDCLRGNTGVELVAIGDLQPDRLERAKKTLSELHTRYPEVAGKYKVSDDKCFSGFDAYQKVLASGVDLVILATPPGFRPLHLAAAVDAGKHIFAEKPVATDLSGIRSVLATYEKANKKGLGIGVGTQRRHNPGYIEVMKRIHDGAVGEVLNGQVFWNQGSLWSADKTADMADSEWQIRNWLYFAWLSGDHIVEQHVHNIDVANWVMGGPPARAIGVGGRAERTDPKFGHIFDHFAIDYEYPNGVHIMSMARQQQRAAGRVGEFFQGTKGKVSTSENGPQRIEGANPFVKERVQGGVSAMQQEHIDLINSIRAGKPHNHLKRIAESTLTAIMGRESAYTGQTIEWSTLLDAKQDLYPVPLGANMAFGALEVPPVPVPGRTKLERTFKDGW